MTKLRGSASSERNGPPVRQIPDIPEPKTRERSPYRVVIINDTGRSRQIELTPFRLRAGLAGLVGAVALIVVATLGVSALLTGKSSSDGQDTALRDKLKILEEELHKKELALAVQEKQLQQVRGLSSVSGSVLPQSGELSDDTELRETSRSDESGPLTAMQQSSAERSTDRSLTEEEDMKPQAGMPPLDSDLQKSRSTEEATPSRTGETDKAARAPIVNFNAEDVTAVSDGENTGTLRFRLVKDRPEVRFAGYLFVYVEMVDERGENKLYVYPQQASRGEGDLPKDYREGESIAFKYNSKVELPYGDVRPSAKLAGVSILLYGENGKIVFQRGFHHRELKVVDARGKKLEGVTTRSTTRRRAL